MKRSLPAFAGRVVVVHTITYILASVGVMFLLDTASGVDALASEVFREMESPWLFAGPFLQPIRGLLIALVIWPIWDMFVAHRLGWLRLWLMLVGIGIIASPVAGPASMEGFLRTVLSIDAHLLILPELLIQTAAFSILLVLWDRLSLRKELAADRDGNVRRAIGGSRYALVAAMGYVGVAIGGFLMIAASPNLSFNDLSADATLQLFNVVLVLVNFALARLFATRLFVPEQRKTGIFSMASLTALLVFLAFNAGGAAFYDTVTEAPMPTALILSVYGVSSVLLWLSAVTLLPGVKILGGKGAEADVESPGSDTSGGAGDSLESLESVDEEKQDD